MRCRRVRDAWCSIVWDTTVDNINRPRLDPCDSTHDCYVFGAIGILLWSVAVDAVVGRLGNCQIPLEGNLVSEGMRET